MYEQQNEHYFKWEEHLINLGFGKPPVDNIEQAEHGNVVFHDGQLTQMF